MFKFTLNNQPDTLDCAYTKTVSYIYYALDETRQKWIYAPLEGSVFWRRYMSPIYVCMIVTVSPIYHLCMSVTMHFYSKGWNLWSLKCINWKSLVAASSLCLYLASPNEWILICCNLLLFSELSLTHLSANGNIGCFQIVPFYSRGWNAYTCKWQWRMLSNFLAFIFYMATWGRSPH